MERTTSDFGLTYIVSLRSGNITRDRTLKQKLLRDDGDPITGLAFKATGRSVHLFVATVSTILQYNVTVKDKEEMVLILFLQPNRIFQEQFRERNRYVSDAAGYGRMRRRLLNYGGFEPGLSIYGRQRKCKL